MKEKEDIAVEVNDKTGAELAIYSAKNLADIIEDHADPKISWIGYAIARELKGLEKWLDAQLPGLGNGTEQEACSSCGEAKAESEEEVFSRLSEKTQLLIDKWHKMIDEQNLDQGNLKDFRGKLISLLKDLVTDFACMTTLTNHQCEDIRGGVNLVAEKTGDHLKRIRKDLRIVDKNFKAVREEISSLEPAAS